MKVPVQRRQLKGEPMPYYIWVIGPPALVSAYLHTVPKDLPPQQAYFGLRYPRVPYGAVLTGLPAGSPLMTGGGGSVMQSDTQSAAKLEVEGVRQRGGIYGGPEPGPAAARLAAAGFSGAAAAGESAGGS
ncbi:MAG: hypothetical protein WKG07_23350 [Hymenobacter sp.]